MEHLLFFPSPNWYLNQVLDLNEDNLLLFGAKNHCFIIKLQANSYSLYKSILRLHDPRVNGVKFGGGPYAESFASCGDDFTVKQVNYINGDVIGFHSKHKDKKPLTLDWDKSGKGLIASGDEGGTIVLWNIKENSFQSLKFFKFSIYTLRFCPYNSSIFAVGCKGGLVYLVSSADTGNLICRLRGHDEDVTSVSWCPFSEDIFNPDKQGCYLASGSRDKVIAIWNTSIQTLSSTFKVPQNTHTLHKSKMLEDSRFWMSLIWHEKHHILSSGPHGELICWLLDKNQSKSEIWGSTTSLLHNRSIFSIAVCNDFAVSLSQDRYINVWNLSSKTVTLQCLTLGGSVYTLEASSLNPEMLAIGGGDNMIRVGNLTSRPVQVQYFWQGIKAKVLSLCWHPDREGYLAYGTEEGRVGVLNTLATKPPLLCRSNHKQAVYRVKWGPNPSNSGGDGSKLVYSCGDGKILIHSMLSGKNETFNLDDLISGCNMQQQQRTEVCWNDDLSLLAIGNNDGSVNIYEKFKLVMTLLGLSKMIISCKFNRLSAQLPNWLAVTSNSGTVCLYDIGKHLQKFECNKVEVVVSKSETQLVGHQGRVTCVDWSSHRIVTASYDRTLQVWDAVSGQPIATFISHSSRVFSCIFHPLLEDEVISGGDDAFLFQWKVSEEGVKDIKEKSKKKKKKKELVEQNDVQKLDMLENVEGLPETIEMENRQSSTVQDKKKKGSTMKSMFPITSNLENKGKLSSLDDCIILHKGEENDPSVLESQMHLGLYGSKQSVMKLVDTEVTKHKENSNHGYINQMSVWTVRMKSCIIDAAEAGELTEEHVAISPYISYEFWKEICTKYSQQLIDVKQYGAAAMYLLMTHQLYPAIELLLDKKLFKEAICIAKSRLPPDDPTVNGCVVKWANHLANEGSYEHAAKCYLSVGMVKESYTLLGKRSDPHCLKLACYLSHSNKDVELSLFYAVRCFNEAFIKEDFTFIQDFIKCNQDYKWLSLLLQMQECYLSFHNLSTSETDSLDRVQHDENSLTFRPLLFKGKSFIDTVKYNWPKDDVGLQESLVKIKDTMFTSQIPKTAKHAQLCLVVYLTAIILKEQQALDYFVPLLTACTMQGYSTLVTNCFQIVFPLGLDSLTNIINLERNVAHKELSTFDALFQFAILCHLHDNQNNSIDWHVRHAATVNRIKQIVIESGDTIDQGVKDSLTYLSREKSGSGSITPVYYKR